MTLTNVGESKAKLYYYCFFLFIVTLGFLRTEGDDTHENEFSQEPLGKPLRHYTILAHCTRSSYPRNIWPWAVNGIAVGLTCY